MVQNPKFHCESSEFSFREEELERFGTENVKEVDLGIGFKMDNLITFIFKTSQTFKLFKTHKGYDRLKF